MNFSVEALGDTSIKPGMAAWVRQDNNNLMYIVVYIILPEKACNKRILVTKNYVQWSMTLSHNLHHILKALRQ